ncbi:DUF973 family protein [Stygiolobus caldivivus]|uniref:Uncharacterized protein n=1 Tax=Stygiolobus caldivivus TaxID=2824673 RepID=A0A8D5U6H3_9CREN|nr:DUF973 family protein [Stygiolobus caldivivus]BCU69893.1 hypothetical protein KN1_11900 [Stygiolobus caldivivus]
MESSRRLVKGLGTTGIIGITVAVVAIVIIAVLAVVLLSGKGASTSVTPTVSSSNYTMPPGGLSSSTSVKPIGVGQMECINGEYQVTVDLNSSIYTKVLSAYIYGTNVKDTAIYDPSLNPGGNLVTICFPVNNPFTPIPGHTYDIVLELSNGQSVIVPVKYQGSAPGGIPTVTQVGTGTLFYNSTSGEYVATIVLHSTATVSIESANIVGTTASATSVSNYTLTAGYNTITLYFPPSNSFTPQPGSTYQVSIGLSDGAVVQVAVSYVGNSTAAS